MPVTVQIAREVIAQVQGLRIIAVRGQDLECSPHAAAEISAFWQTAWSSISLASVPVVEQPQVSTYRAVLRDAGIKVRDYPPAIEALYRRALRGGPAFTINPLVDFYNACSLIHFMPVAGFNLDFLHDNLRLIRFSGDESFEGLGREVPEVPKAGEIGYLANGMALSRHFMWRQSRHAQLGTTTRNVLLLTEAVAGISDDTVQSMGHALSDGLKRWFGARVKTGELNEAAATLSFDSQ